MYLVDEGSWCFYKCRNLKVSTRRNQMLFRSDPKPQTEPLIKKQEWTGPSPPAYMWQMHNLSGAGTLSASCGSYSPNWAPLLGLSGRRCLVLKQLLCQGKLVPCKCSSFSEMKSRWGRKVCVQETLRLEGEEGLWSRWNKLTNKLLI